MKEKNEDMIGVQPMSPEDLPVVLRLERESFGQMAWTERDFRSAMASDYDYPMVLHARMSRTAMPEKGAAAENAGRETPPEKNAPDVSAYAVLRVLAPEAEIENICVAPAYRRGGLGVCLMQEMLETAAKKGAVRIFLEVRAHNEAAQALYRKMGFSEAYVRKAYYRSPMDDAIIMMKEIGNA